MTHTSHTSVVATAIKNLLQTNQQSLGLSLVLYGQQLMIPQSPAAVVVPGPKQRMLVGIQGPGGRTDNFLTVYIEVHNSMVGSEDEERLIVDQIAEGVEDKIHSDTTMGGLVIHGFVER